jgi:hypothetical protein
MGEGRGVVEWKEGVERRASAGGVRGRERSDLSGVESSSRFLWPRIFIAATARPILAANQKSAPAPGECIPGPRLARSARSVTAVRTFVCAAPRYKALATPTGARHPPLPLSFRKIETLTGSRPSTRPPGRSRGGRSQTSCPGSTFGRTFPERKGAGESVRERAAVRSRIAPALSRLRSFAVAPHTADPPPRSSPSTPTAQPHQSPHPWWQGTGECGPRHARTPSQTPRALLGRTRRPPGPLASQSLPPLSISPSLTSNSRPSTMSRYRSLATSGVTATVAEGAAVLAGAAPAETAKEVRAGARPAAPPLPFLTGRARADTRSVCARAAARGAAPAVERADMEVARMVILS